MNEIDDIGFYGIEDIPQLYARAEFITTHKNVFREQYDGSVWSAGEGFEFIPWGGDNQMPYDILAMIEEDETLTTCLQWNAEICYGDGLMYDTENCSDTVRKEVDEYCLDNNISSLYMGCCQDIKHFGFCVVECIINKENGKITRMNRLNACYCRFSPANERGTLPYVLFGNWRISALASSKIEKIPLINCQSPWSSIKELAEKGIRKIAFLAKIPTADNTYYPIPFYASLFKGSWYEIKRLIGIAKKSRLKNAAPIKYQIEVSDKYWNRIFQSEHIHDRKAQQERVAEEKKKMIDFLTGVENTGKAWFSTFYETPDGREQHLIRINKIDSDKEGGEWSSDIQESVNMMCFALRVHSNLVGSVPGKAQTNNSGSDKRELYTIAQALQKSYRDILFMSHRILIKYNGWDGCYPKCPFIQLTTLDEHKDAKLVENGTIDNRQ